MASKKKSGAKSEVHSLNDLCGDINLPSRQALHREDLAGNLAILRMMEQAFVAKTVQAAGMQFIIPPRVAPYLEKHSLDQLRSGLNNAYQKHKANGGFSSDFSSEDSVTQLSTFVLAQAALMDEGAPLGEEKPATKKPRSSARKR